MSQQTSISNFFKSVHPNKRQLDKKPEVIASKFPDKHNLKTKASRRYGKLKKEPPPAATPKKPSNQSEISSNIIESADVKNEPSSPKTPKLNRSVSSPGSDRQTLKRSNSGNSPSPRKKSQTNGSRSVTKHLKNRSSRRLFQNESIDTVKVSDMVENLRLCRAGLYPKHDLNLEKFYSELNGDTAIVDIDVDQVSHIYDISRVIIPREKHAEHLFSIITQVFSNLSNCGYFSDTELDMVFGILCLSEKTQMLLARMIKRKCCWKRVNSIEYPEIDQNLRPYFDELETQRLITSALDKECLESMLPMLLADEVHEICRQSKIPRQSNKDLAIKQLLKNSCIKALFPGAESPAIVLKKRVLTALGHCVCLPREVVSLIDRIVTLFIPSEDPTSKLSDIFLMLTIVKEGTLRFPDIPVHNYPVFENREHLVRYVERRNDWSQAMEMQKGVKENWETFRTIGRDAYSRLTLLLEEGRNSQQKFIATPKHVRKFREEYVCVKIITACIEIFKKENSTVKEAVDMLKGLINQEVYLQNKKGEWYEELALIEMKHNKNLEIAALLTIEGLGLPKITESGKHALTKRAATLAKRKTGVNMELKSQLKDLIDKEALWNTPTVSVNANVMQGNQPGRKSTWSMDMGGGDKGYMSVEHRAQYYYRYNDYPDGWHCEGSLPVTLFTLLFWEVLYSIPVPAAYLSAYQKAPLDLFTSDFYKNRKMHLDNRVEYIKALSNDQLGDLIEESLEIRQHYQSLMPNPLAVSKERLKDAVRCMGTVVVIGICQRLFLNFSGCRAGFPDLLVWNPITLKCKFVEVKGPGDTLSAKQTLWLMYLAKLGAVTELCEVKAVPVAKIE